MSDQIPISPHDFQALARKYYYDSKRNGRENYDALIMLGAVTAFIGVQMALSGFEKKHGKSVFDFLLPGGTHQR